MFQLTSLCTYICIYSIIHVAFPESCDFQTYCSEWTFDNNWKIVRSGQFQGISNVPKTDHTFGKNMGSYLYLMTNSTPDQINVAMLLSKTLKQPYTCLTFWYSMYESDLQSLKVFRKTGDSTMVEIWNKIGNLPNVWNEAKVEFSYDREFQLIFEGTKGSAGHMALDDISVTRICPATSTATQSASDNITSIGNKDSKKNQLSYGVYVGIATGLAAILLIAGIVTLIIARRRVKTTQTTQLEAVKSHEKDNVTSEIYCNIGNDVSEGNVDYSKANANTAMDEPSSALYESLKKDKVSSNVDYEQQLLSIEKEINAMEKKKDDLILKKRKLLKKLKTSESIKK